MLILKNCPCFLNEHQSFVKVCLSKFGETKPPKDASPTRLKKALHCLTFPFVFFYRIYANHNVE
ncbi:hypothetical protein CW304_31230 [Bacillus sp. UFRGS-B20]|nr:hypothetical protein CW304_31230 [Bacillus sp. UFRGS-B20]